MKFSQTWWPLAVAALLLLAFPVAPARAATYLVLYGKSAVPSDASRAISSAGGTLVYGYSAIGVAIARSTDPAFRANIMKDARVEGAAATDAFAVQLSDGTLDESGPADVPSLNTPAPGSDALSGLQWDMDQIRAPEARAITGGSSAVLVGIADTGIDYTHPDLAPNIDFANSASCIGGVPNQDPSAWDDDNGHGTHTAGTVAAAKNGIGIVGVAPNVRLAAIKAGNSAGFFYPEAVVCAFMWAASHHVAVVNNSYFADPWQFNCANDPEQRAIWKAERRAIQYAMSKGAVVVAAAGNQADDLAHPTQDLLSPDNTTPVARVIHNDCRVVPVEIPGVIGVTASGNQQLKSYYSNYGVGTTAVIAPGGDSVLQRTAAAPNGLVLSTWPASLPCARKVVDASTGAVYCYFQGTSMAAPHVTGVAALVASQKSTPPGMIGAVIANTADPTACPADLSPYAFFPAVDDGAPQSCEGGPGYNAWNGHGQVNALRAVSGR